MRVWACARVRVSSKSIDKNGNRLRKHKRVCMRNVCVRCERVCMCVHVWAWPAVSAQLSIPIILSRTSKWIEKNGNRLRKHKHSGTDGIAGSSSNAAGWPFRKKKKIWEKLKQILCANTKKSNNNKEEIARRRRHAEVHKEGNTRGEYEKTQCKFFLPNAQQLRPQAHPRRQPSSVWRCHIAGHHPLSAWTQTRCFPYCLHALLLLMQHRD